MGPGLQDGYCCLGHRLEDAGGLWGPGPRDGSCTLEAALVFGVSLLMQASFDCFIVTVLFWVRDTVRQLAAVLKQRLLTVWHVFRVLSGLSRLSQWPQLLTALIIYNTK